jgi:ketosteroid isomerase-like protein
MGYAVPRAVVEAFYTAYATRDAPALSALLHDDVVWTISGPVEILSYCGTHRGKATVLDLIIRVVPSMFRVISYVPEAMLVEGERVAMLNRRSAQSKADGKVISYRVANFMRFRDDKLVENLSLLDSFDAAEQVLGHPLTLHSNPSANRGRVVAI